MEYDALGRIWTSNQVTNGNTYPFSYSYNLADGLTVEAYPSGRIVNTCHDWANRVSQVSLSACGDLTGAYASKFVYAAHGAATQMVFGNVVTPNATTNVWHEPSYNSRLQMSGFADLVGGSSSTPYLNATMNWGTTQNNRNLMGSTFTHTGGAGLASPVTFSQVYSYDGVNRLGGVTDTSGSTTNYARTFGYDSYGNMALTYASGITPPGNTPSIINSAPWPYNGNNQFNSATYDQAGNELLVNGNNVTYDFEGRQISVSGTAVNETYVYDGDGKRVGKTSTAGTSVFVYDALGRMAAEYSTLVDTPNCVTCYLSADHLGTARLITDQSGLVVSR